VNVKILLISTVSILSGCATMDSSLSCNETAFDSCMTIAQADRLSSRNTEKNQSNSNRVSKSIDTKTLAGSKMVITPWVDNKGQAHSGEELNFSSNGA